MITTTITNFRENLSKYVSNVIRSKDPMLVTTKEGNAILLSEEEYNGMLATMEIMSVPGMVERINAAANEPDSELVDAKEIDW